MEQALEMLVHFQNAIIGISKGNLSNGNPGVEIIRRLSLTKMLPSAYAYSNIDDENNESFDMEVLVQKMARIKNVARNDIARQIRKNVIFLYQF